MKPQEKSFHTFSFYEIAKRVIDIVVSTIMLVLFSPIIFITAILIKLDSPGPVFADMPKRVGKHGKLFFMFKFRSMFTNAHQILRTNPEYAALFEEYKANNFKIPADQDPRVTKIGKFLRKSSLDEIPQFLNAFRGEMSIVGPRAYFPDELQRQGELYPKSRKLIKKTIAVKPGVTGPWQVGGRSAISFPKRIQMDAEYAQRRSLLYDFVIMLQTPFAVLFRKGAI